MGELKPSALVTGAAGQDGRILTRQLLDRGYQVTGVVRPGSEAKRLYHLDERCEFVPVDLGNTVAVSELVESLKPREIYNLAGVSSSGGQWDSASVTARTNGIAVIDLLDILRRKSPQSRFCQASSCEMFGPATGSSQSEKAELKPDTPYAIAKAQAHFAVKAFRQRFGLFACSAIMFSHSSEHRSESFLLGKVAKAAAEISAGRRSELRLWNIQASRDWGYAEDYMRAMQMMLSSDTAQDYVVATGILHTVANACEVAFSYVGLDYRNYVVVEQDKIPSGGVGHLGDASKISRDLGWKPKVDFQTMIQRMVDYHRRNSESGS